VPVRVATFNILHGVPQRDLKAAQPDLEQSADLLSGTPVDTGSDPRPALSRSDPSVRAREVEPAEDLLDDLPDDVDPTRLKVPGADPERRVVWSPRVQDTRELLRAIGELCEPGTPDLLALQEVDVGQERTAAADQVAEVARAIGAVDWRFAPSVVGFAGIRSEGGEWVPATSADDWPPLPPATRYAGPSAPPQEDSGREPTGPRYGIALLSRYPVREWRIKRFPPAPLSLPLLAPTDKRRPRAVRVPDEPRVVLAAIVAAPGADLTIATAHLSFVPGYNTRQLTEARAFLGGLPRPLILMGDFNTPGKLPGLVTGWDQVARVPTYPVAHPRVQFDHILADGWTAEALGSARGSVQALPLPVSDHCALVADFPDP
jgi:endonuclease/exonuclease/phosphatase family metal-dependent hydrolase